MEAFFRGSHTTNFVTCGFNRSYNQAAQVPSSNVTCSSPRSPLMNCRMMLAFVSTTHSSTILPAEFMTAMEMLSLWTSMPIYFVSFIGDAPFGRRWDQHSLTYSRGAPLYCVVLPECGPRPELVQFPHSDNHRLSGLNFWAANSERAGSPACSYCQC